MLFGIQLDTGQLLRCFSQRFRDQAIDRPGMPFSHPYVALSLRPFSHCSHCPDIQVCSSLALPGIKVCCSHGETGKMSTKTLPGFNLGISSQWSSWSIVRF